MATKQSTQESNGVASLEDWKGRRYALATLPTGLKVRLRSVTLDELAAADALPDDLVAAAWYEKMPGGIAAQIPADILQTQDGRDRARKLSVDALALRDRLVVAAVVEPVITEEDVPDLDPFDKDMIANLSSRQSDLDAEGRRVWGVEPLNTFQVFREAHGCSDDCKGCDNVVSQFSSIHVA